MISQNELKELLHYSIITGQFYWIKPRRGVKVGSLAGTLQSNGYRYISVKNKDCLAHRLAWFWVKGEWPEYEIDHVNGLTDKNHWLNLREATRSQNMCNKGMHLNNTSGYKGVIFNKPSQKWIAQIGLNKKSKHLGYFDDIEAARMERLKAESEFHGEFSRT